MSSREADRLRNRIERAESCWAGIRLSPEEVKAIRAALDLGEAWEFLVDEEEAA